MKRQFEHTRSGVPARAKKTPIGAGEAEGQERLEMSAWFNMIVWVFAYAIAFALAFSIPIWGLRWWRRRFAGLAWAQMSPARAVGDLAMVALLFTIAAQAAEFSPTLARCFNLLGGCDVPGGSLLWAWGFSFQVATVPLGIACVAITLWEIVWRVRHSR
jgi:NADH:ubiquinone oxidoreductase subunit 6 (subunit J)